MKGLLFLSLAMMLSACSYQFSEDRNFVTVPRPQINKLVTIDLDNVGTDTLLIYQPVNLKYTISGVNALDVRNIVLELVNTSIGYGLTGLNGTATLVPPSNTKGLFQLRLTVYSNSGSGSLADKSEAEKVVYMKEWPVTVNTQAPDPLPITAITRANGSLKIEWEKYALAKFSSYVFIRNSNEAIYIHNPDSNFYYDSKFLSGSATYSVTLVADGGVTAVPGPSTNYTDTTTAHLVGQELVNNQLVKLTWSRGAYPANVKRFEIRVGESSVFADGTVIHDSQTITDTTVTIPAVLGRALNFLVRSSPSVNTSWNNDEDQVIKGNKFKSGESFSPFNQIRFSSAANRFYTLTSTQLIAYNMTDCAMVQSYNIASTSKGYPFDVNLSGDKVVVVQGQDQVAVVYDAVTFLPISQIDLSAEMVTGDIAYSVAFSQNDQVYITKAPSGPSPISKVALLIYDLASGTLVKVIDQGPVPPFGSFMFSGGQSRLSADNRFIYYEAELNTNNGVVGEIQNDVVIQSFILGWPLPNPSNGNLVLTATYGGNKIGVFDWPSQTFVNVINTFSDFNPKDFLPERNIVVGYRAGTATVFDYMAQQTLYSIEAEGLILSLEGNYLYASSGARIKFN